MKLIPGDREDFFRLQRCHGPLNSTFGSQRLSAGFTQNRTAAALGDACQTAIRTAQSDRRPASFSRWPESGATTMTSPSRGWKPSINRIFWPWVTTTSVPGPRHASIVARAPAVSASRLAFNTKALLKVGASSTGPMFINSAVCRHRHHWELTILPTLTCCVRKRSPRARASARPCSLKLRWVAQSSSL